MAIAHLTEELLDAFAAAGAPSREVCAEYGIDAPAGDGRLELFDVEQRNFGARIGSRGEAAFFVLYTVRGERRKRRYMIGPYGKEAWRLKLPRGAAKDDRTARDAARQVLGLVAKGGDPQGERMGEHGALLFEDLALRYLEHARRHKRTWEQDLRTIGGFRVDEGGRIVAARDRAGALLPAWRGRKAKSLRKADVLAVLEPIVARDAPIAANRTRVLISRLFAWGMEQDLVEHQPTAGTRPPAPERAGQRVLTEGEMGLLYRICTGAGPLGDVVRLLILLWLRRAEVAELEISELSDDLQTWEIAAERMKNKRAHVVPLPAPAHGIIAARLAKHAGGNRLFVSSRGEPLHPDTVTDYIGELATMMRVRPFTQRDIRRSCTSLGGRLGIDPDTRMRLLSHTDPTVHGKHYDRYDYLPEKRHALTLWAAAVEKWATKAHSAAASDVPKSAPSTAPGRARRARAASPDSTT